jgi:hypothetical protein
MDGDEFFLHVLSILPVYKISGYLLCIYVFYGKSPQYVLGG